MGLPIALHSTSVGAAISGPPTSSGYPSSYFEYHNIVPTIYMEHLNSLICEGVFEKFPDLAFILTEGGVGWLPHLMWRMDKNYKTLSEQTPWLDQLPSQYVLEHVRFTQQPIEEPKKPEHLKQIYDMIHAEKVLMFSSDYPHWDGDYHEIDALPGMPSLSDSQTRSIMYENASDLYNLPS